MINGRFMSSPETMTSPHKTLEELNLLKCSLLPGELLEFIADSSQWNDLLETYALDPDCELPDLAECPAPHFQLKLEASSDVYYDVVLPPGYAAAANTLPVVSVKGDNLGRTEQERWQRVVADALANVHGSEYVLPSIRHTSFSDALPRYPLFELISSHLLPCLHEALDHTNDLRSTPDPSASTPERDEARRQLSSPRYHALFVSHHLKSPQKRRSLSQWSHELSLSGFAKVGYPGVIYCEGTREDVEDFVDRVKSMQWLALRLRFIEPAPSVGHEEDSEEGQRGRWTEFEKVGEVVEEMRRLKRENFVVEMGIGSAGNSPAK